MKSAIAIQCLPMTGAPKEEVYRLVDAAIAAIDASGLTYRVTPMETVVEGPLDQLLEVAGQAHKAVLELGGGRGVFTYIKLASAEDLGTSAEKVRKYQDS